MQFLFVRFFRISFVSDLKSISFQCLCDLLIGSILISVLFSLMVLFSRPFNYFRFKFFLFIWSIFIFLNFFSFIDLHSFLCFFSFFLCSFLSFQSDQSHSFLLGERVWRCDESGGDSGRRAAGAGRAHAAHGSSSC